MQFASGKTGFAFVYYCPIKFKSFQKPVMIKLFIKHTSLTVQSHLGYVPDTSTLTDAEISMLFGFATSYFISQEQLCCNHMDEQCKKKSRYQYELTTFPISTDKITKEGDQ